MLPNFVNRTIWTGDNLDIMRGMNSETIDLIYLDPPFNSNKDYAAPVGSKAAGAAFKDTWTLSDLDVAWAGYIADEHPAVAYLLSGAGMAHSKGMQSYLTMIGGTDAGTSPCPRPDRLAVAALRFNGVALSEAAAGRRVRTVLLPQ